MSTSTKRVGVFCDGCYDIFHFGHANQFLQAKRMGDFLVAGIHPDEVILANKGLPVVKQEDRYEIVRSVRWIDNVMEGIGYDITADMLDSGNCDICVHGDDVVITEAGNDAYAAIRKQNRYKTCRRTPEISTTNLIARVLYPTKHHHFPSSYLPPAHLEYARQLASCSKGINPWVSIHQYDPEALNINQLIEGRPQSHQRVVYVDGSFDMFHIGHLRFLKEASERGDWLVVGVHTDSDVNAMKGQTFPIMSYPERVLTLLSCKYVDATLLGAPRIITSDLLQYFNVSKVVHGSITTSKTDSFDPYEIPRNQGIFEIIDSKSDMSTSNIVARILENRLEYEARNSKLEQRAKAASTNLELSKAHA